MAFRPALVLGMVLVVASAAPSTQTLTRRATTVAAIHAYPAFHHGQAVVVAGRVTRIGDQLTLVSDGGTLQVSAPDGLDEGDAVLRGQVFDLGRLNPDDPRIGILDTSGTLARRYQDHWPRPGEDFLLAVAGSGPLPAPVSLDAVPIRMLVLTPERFEGERVSVVGQFRGRNLYADLPAAATDGRSDFVLRSADAALWVTGLEPRGDGFRFDPRRRVDTGQWVRVSGTVRHGQGLVWLEGTQIHEAEEPEDSGAVDVEVPLPPTPPLEVFFSAPTQGELNVQIDALIRIQFSRDLDPATLDERIRVTYSAHDTGGHDDPARQPVSFSTRYLAATRSIEIAPTEPLQPFREVTVELLEGLQGPTGQPLEPWTLTFSTGGP